MRSTLLVALSLALLAAGPCPAASADPVPSAAPTTAAAPSACGFHLSVAATKLWKAFGGEGGSLGCPTADETDASPSPHGSQSRVTPFGDRGAIFVLASGPAAGQAVAITNCYPLYYQYGGSSGWLGLPLDNAVNTPDGQKQVFEGGDMRFGRALQTCDATAGADEP